MALLEPRLRKRITQHEGLPVLSAGFESSVRGLHFVGAAAVGSLGPLLRFIAGAGFAARRLTRVAQRGMRRSRQLLAEAVPVPLAPTASSVTSLRPGRSKSARQAMPGGLVIGGAHVSIAIARSLGRRGIRVWLLANHPLPTYSRYLERSFPWPRGGPSAGHFLDHRSGEGTRPARLGADHHGRSGHAHGRDEPYTPC